jgi:O-antigen/teichoic acid export membrane protein
MSRFRRMAHNVASSYAALIAASIFSLASVPLALHYLGAESGRFALWLLMATITGYLTLIDLGMSNSVARLLIDYKDRREDGEYGSLIKTGWLVLLVQAAIILCAGVSLAPVLASLLKIAPDLRNEFIRLLSWQSGSMALAFALRIFSHILNAHQRNDIQNYGQITGFGLNFFLMWIFFQAGHGVFSLAWATLLTNLYGGLLCLGTGWHLKLYPPRGAWGRVSGARFRELFSYGQAIFWVSLGTQMALASQILIIQRSLGPVAATVWGIGIRMYSLVSQLIWRVSDSAAPAFSEMIVRGEREKLLTRYREMVILTASLSGFCAVGFALCNHDFVFVWTRGRIVWPAINDVGLALWMVVMAVVHCHNSFVLWTKRIATMPYFYFIEGIVFITAALLTVKTGGMIVMIGCSLVCSCSFTGAYGVWRISKYFGISKREIVFQWSGLMVKTAMLCLVVAVPTWVAAQAIQSPLTRLMIYVLTFGTLGSVILLRYGLPLSFQKELSTRAPRLTLPLLRKILITD